MLPLMTALPMIQALVLMGLYTFLPMVECTPYLRTGTLT